MMKMMGLLLLVGVCCVPLATAVEIYEIYYDPVGTEAGGEAIVLYNGGLSEIDVGGWYLHTESSDMDAIFPKGSSILSEGYFLIADSGWSERKDEIHWPNADYEEPLTLSNGDGGVGLFDEDGNMVDKVGWGDVSGIESDLYLGNPAADASSGESLLRVNSNGNNNDDFVVGRPVILSKHVPFVTNSTQTSLQLSIEVTSLSSLVSSFIIQGSNVIEENKVLLTPGGSSDFEIIISLTEEVGEVLYSGDQMEYVDGEYRANVSVGYTKPPGIYEVDIEIDDEMISLSYEVLPLLSIGLDTRDLSFSAKRDDEFLISGDTDYTTRSKPTIKTLGNIPFEVGLSGSTFTSDDDELDLNSIQYILANQTEYHALSVEEYFPSIVLGIGDVLALGFKINLDGASDGLYQGSVLVSARKSS